ncbi:hypothetical protein ACGFYU_08475 [Streptomyces sp. NPDC048337]|uniref:hypothetical protein n=1 Tax=Streptomyces sp. NPDC048337 TaxID=3365535 RepID=UPI00371C0AEF
MTRRHGVSPASATTERYYSRPDVTWVPFHDAPPIDYGFIWPTTAETPLVRAFVELCPTSSAPAPALE